MNNVSFSLQTLISVKQFPILFSSISNFTADYINVTYYEFPTGVKNVQQIIQSPF